MELEARDYQTSNVPQRGNEDAPADRVETLLAETSMGPRSAATPHGAVLGTLTGWDEVGRPLIAYAGHPSDPPQPALTAVPLKAADWGREVALLFVAGDLARPLIVGVLQPPGLPVPVVATAPVQATVDGERLEFTAGREIVFRCGEASITLTRAGKVLIQGAYLLSRSTGVHRIKGGSVQIN